MKKVMENKKGITLVALVITIIILLILAGITISQLIGSKLFENARLTEQKYKEAQEKENDILADYENMMVSLGGARDVDLTEIQQLMNQMLDIACPVGSIITQMGNSAPEGYVICDGSTYNINDEKYKRLANYIETQFGNVNYFGGDKTNGTFAVPNLQGEFLRGAGTNSYTNQGSGTDVGKHQNATAHIKFGLTVDSGSTPASNSQIYFPNIPDGITERTSYSSSHYDSQFRASAYGNNKLIYTNGTKNAVTSLTGYYTQNMDNTAYYTSRPTNTSVLYCIRY